MNINFQNINNKFNTKEFESCLFHFTVSAAMEWNEICLRLLGLWTELLVATKISVDKWEIILMLNPEPLKAMVASWILEKVNIYASLSN